jgi:hypothetical protein
MEKVAANMIFRLKMDPPEYGRKLQGILTSPQFGISWSDVVSLSTGIDYAVPPLESHNCQILTGYGSMKMLSANVCLK